MVKVLIHAEGDGNVHLVVDEFDADNTLCEERLHPATTVHVPKLAVTCVICQAVERYPKCKHRLINSRYGLLCAKLDQKGNIWGRICSLAHCPIEAKVKSVAQMTLDGLQELHGSIHTLDITDYSEKEHRRLHDLMNQFSTVLCVRVIDWEKAEPKLYKEV